MEVETSRAAMDLVTRNQLAQDHLKQLYEEVRSYAAAYFAAQRDRKNHCSHYLAADAWTTLELVRRRVASACLKGQVGGIDLETPDRPFSHAASIPQHLGECDGCLPRPC